VQAAPERVFHCPVTRDVGRSEKMKIALISLVGCLVVFGCARDREQEVSLLFEKIEGGELRLCIPQSLITRFDLDPGDVLHDAKEEWLGFGRHVLWSLIHQSTNSLPEDLDVRSYKLDRQIGAEVLDSSWMEFWAANRNGVLEFRKRVAFAESFTEQWVE
jgi:hypothetical protein